MLIFLVNLMILFSVILIIIYPLFKKVPAHTLPVRSGMNKRLQELLSMKENVYATLKELEFDYKTGKLSTEDYSELVNSYKQKGLLLLKEIDQMQNEEGLEDQIEKEIQLFKERLKGK